MILATRTQRSIDRMISPPLPDKTKQGVKKVPQKQDLDLHEEPNPRSTAKRKPLSQCSELDIPTRRYDAMRRSLSLR